MSTDSVTGHTTSASPFQRVVRTIPFHARGERPVLNLAVSRKCIEWLLGVIPTADGAHATLQRELDALSDEERAAP